MEQKGIGVKPEIFACLPTLQSLQLASEALLPAAGPERGWASGGIPGPEED